ncbi:MAG: bifunctional DNA-binding transcriptional regulator/O6-methylguanine-DNA methyltransferase Ada [Acidobacteriaceae bacterium]
MMPATALFPMRTSVAQPSAPQKSSPHALSVAEASEAQWRAVLARDLLAEGAFVYAVRTTGIFCRPSCPSRRPARGNVVFFQSPAQARAAGYRACLRCQPEAAHPQSARLSAACQYLGQPHEKAPTLAELGRVVGMSPYALQRLFRQVVGVTPRQYRAMLQTERFRGELGSSGSVTNAIYQAGYGSSSRVYENSASSLGMTPAAYRKGGAGQKIRYTLADSPIGRILVAATERGLCAVAFGDTDRDLCMDLQREFHNALLERDDATLSGPLALVLGQIKEHPLSLSLALDARATAFQSRVWAALRQIPAGETRSYGQIAEGIGQPSAVRAVARACGQNALAVVVPCHRVVGKKGRLTGYRWGIERKKTLLELERGASHANAALFALENDNLEG